LWVVVGLGNPGKQYSSSRHNAGFTLIQRLADKRHAKLRKRKYSAKAARIELENRPVLLAKPWTFMNKSGVAVRGLITQTGVKLDHVLVVYDDLDIPLGEIRIRKMGGPGTHNGMASIVQETGSTNFPRIRIGIGPLPLGVDATDYVLANFQEEERQMLEDSLVMAENAVALVIASGIEEAMNRFNRKINDTNPSHYTGFKNSKESNG
jgi:PTH1 family peptidyl-tRNA hydrolase